MTSFEFDAFICHASEDKRKIAEPLAMMFQAKNLKVWYDKFTLTVGDSLRRKIDDGLARSRYGVVILSPSFFKKNWPQMELNGLAAREDSEGHKVILPVWHNVSRDYVIKYSPMLADRLASKTTEGLPIVLGELLEVISPQHLSKLSKRKGSKRKKMAPGGLLGYSKLIRALKSKEISFDPDIRLKQVGLCSIDLRLGFYFSTLQASVDPVSNNTSNVHGFVSTGYYGDQGLGNPRSFILKPNEFVWARTLEEVRLSINLAAVVEGITRLARYGLSMQPSHIHPGFRGSISIGLFNQGPLQIKLDPGEMICRLFFCGVSPPTLGDLKKLSSYGEWF